LKVLVIEDDRDLSTMIELGLVLEGHDVELANDGPTGMAEAASGRFDAIVVDLMLPGASGDEVVRATHRALGPATPTIVLMSAARHAADLAAELGVRHLPKPFVMTDLAPLLGG
jgi:two-component system OmpR family response regulator